MPLTDIDAQRLGDSVADKLSNRNLIINGGMTVAQRSTQVTGVTSDGYRTVDRFKIQLNSLGTWTVDQSTDSPDGFANSLKVTCTTPSASPGASSYSYLMHRIEAQNLQHLSFGSAAAQDTVVSFYVKSNKTGNASFNVIQPDASFKLIPFQYSISAANTWELKSFVIPGDASGTINDDNGHGMQLEWWFNSGSNWTGGTHGTTWTANTSTNRNASNLGVGGATSDNFAIAGVQLEVGNTATPFEQRSFGDELLRCQRYCHKYSGDNSGSSQYSRFPIGANGNSNEHTCGLPHPVPMRSCTKAVSASVASVSVYSPGSNINASSPTFSINADAQSFDVGYIVIGGFTGLTGDIVAAARVNNDSDFYIIFDAEL